MREDSWHGRESAWAKARAHRSRYTTCVVGLRQKRCPVTLDSDGMGSIPAIPDAQNVPLLLCHERFNEACLPDGGRYLLIIDGEKDDCSDTSNEGGRGRAGAGCAGPEQNLHIDCNASDSELCALPLRGSRWQGPGYTLDRLVRAATCWCMWRPPQRGPAQHQRKNLEESKWFGRGTRAERLSE